MANASRRTARLGSQLALRLTRFYQSVIKWDGLIMLLGLALFVAFALLALVIARPRLEREMERRHFRNREKKRRRYYARKNAAE